jgi:bifunctional non-homologous end joining protein LigD
VAFQHRKPKAIGLKASLPGFVEPALASSIEKVPSGARWIHEIKFDGYRAQVHLADEATKIFTRRGHDWTHRFKEVAHDARRINASSAVVDGETRYRPPTARPTSRSCRTSLRASRQASCWSSSTSCT